MWRQKEMFPYFLYYVKTMSSFHVGSVKSKDAEEWERAQRFPGESALSPCLPAFLAESRSWEPSWNSLMVIRRQNTIRQTAEKGNFRAVTPLRTVLSWLARAW